MLDIKLIRQDPSAVKNNLTRRNNSEKLKLLDELLKVDEQWRKAQSKINELRQQRNSISIEISNIKKAGKPLGAKLEEGKEVDTAIKENEKKLDELQAKEKELLLNIPNLLHESVPLGKDGSENVEIRKWGSPPKFDFKPKNHQEILESLGLLDTEKAAKTSGSGFVYMIDELALLDLAIQKYAIDFLRKKKFTIIEPPLMINKKAYDGMIGNPFDFAEASYKIDGEELYLVPTAEYPLGAMFVDHVFNEDDLPLKLCGVSAAFRKEVGAHGKYTKGLFRMHQFNKIEQFVFCTPEESWKVLEELQKNSEEMYQGLGLHYRVLALCSGDTGAKSAKTYDTEFWMADGQFREIGSNSNCTDYQARRLNIKYREGEGKPIKGLAHTLNNTALATSRTIIAIVEQFQQKDGSVLIPKVLQKHMDGIDRLEAK